MTRIWDRDFDRSTCFGRKSVTMAQVPWSTMPEFHRPVFVKLITWGFILLYLYTCLGSQDLDGFLHCSKCGLDITRAKWVTKMPSKLAISHRNETILGVPGVLIQEFVNPSGEKFELITTKTADVYKRDKAYAVYSWFPDFLWRIALCPKCGFQLGWAFEPAGQMSKDKKSEKSFVALILDHLLHKDYADNLIFVPKFKNS